MKRKTISLILILVYFGSLFAYGSYYFYSSSSPKEVSIENKKIIDRKFKESEISNLLPKGYTLIEIYLDGSENSTTIRYLLEQKVKSNTYQKTILAEILSTNFKVRIISANGDKTLINPSQEEVEKEICKLIIYKPAECALINV